MKLNKNITDIIWDNAKKCKSASSNEMAFGVLHNEPLLCMLNSILQYCEDYASFTQKLIGNDWYAKQYVKDMLDNVEALLNCQGGVAMRYKKTTDSKDNGTMSDIINMIRYTHIPEN